MQRPEPEMSEEEQQQIRQNMGDFNRWQSHKISELSDEKHERAEEVAKNVREDGFWMNEDSVLNLYIIHDLSFDQIEEDITEAIEEAKGWADEQ